MAEKLKPCEYCGGEVELQQAANFYSLRCTACGIETIGRRRVRVYRVKRVAKEVTK